MLFVGTWLEITASCIILAPILAPVMEQVGIHPVHFAVVMIVTLNVGLITPPLGVALFAAVGVGNVSFEEVVSELWPFLALDLFVILLLVFHPGAFAFNPQGAWVHLAPYKIILKCF